jgi:ABC-type spermidine/putrescine transport system permease subunit II
MIEGEARGFRRLHNGYLIVILGLLVLPLIALLPMSFSPTATVMAWPASWSARWYHEVASSPEWRRALGWSLLTATFASAIATAAGYFGAAAIVRAGARGSSALQMLLLSPMMVPQVVVALSTYVLATSLGLHGHWLILSVGQSLLGLPVAAMIIAASLRGIHETVIRAGISLGGSRSQVFWRIIFPMSLHGILSAAALTFLIAFDELLIAVFLATPSLQTLPVRIYESVHYELNPAVAVVSVLLTALLCAGVIINQLFQWTAARLKETAS